MVEVSASLSPVQVSGGIWVLTDWEKNPSTTHAALCEYDYVECRHTGSSAPHQFTFPSSFPSSRAGYGIHAPPIEVIRLFQHCNVFSHSSHLKQIRLFAHGEPSDCAFGRGSDYRDLCVSFLCDNSNCFANMVNTYHTETVSLPRLPDISCTGACSLLFNPQYIR